MKKIIGFYIVLLILIWASFMYEGCSKLNDNVTGPSTSNFLGPHPAGWHASDARGSSDAERTVFGAIRVPS